MRWGKEMPVTPDTVTVLGRRVKASDPAWLGLNWSDVIEREKSTLVAFLCGGWDKAPPDHHLCVAWMHPSDQEDGWDSDPSGWARYRVRPRRQGYRFVQTADGIGWKLMKVRR